MHCPGKKCNYLHGQLQGLENRGNPVRSRKFWKGSKGSISQNQFHGKFKNGGKFVKLPHCDVHIPYH